MPDTRVQIDGTMVLVGAGIAAVAAIYFARGQIAESVKTAVDPTDEDNLANRGAQHVYRELTGSTGTLGGDVYDATQAAGERFDWLRPERMGAAVAQWWRGEEISGDQFNRDDMHPPITDGTTEPARTARAGMS